MAETDDVDDTEGDPEGEAPLLKDAEGDDERVVWAATPLAKSAIARATRPAEE